MLIYVKNIKKCIFKIFNLCKCNAYFLLIYVNNIDKKNIQKNLIYVNFMIILCWFILISQTDGRTGRACLKDVHVLSFICIIFFGLRSFQKNINHPVYQFRFKFSN